MFERFTDQARRTMAIAHEIAKRLGTQYIDSVQVFLAILKSPSEMTIAMMKEVGADREKLRSELEGPLQASLLNAPITLTTSAKAVVIEAVEEARRLNHSWVGSEHLLMAVVKHAPPELSEILKRHGLTSEPLSLALAACVRAAAEQSTSVTAASPTAGTRAPEPVGAYPSCRRVGALLFISGQGPRQRGSKDIPGVELNAAGRLVYYDMEAQVRAVMQNLRYILEENGSAWERIVDMTCFLTDLRRDFAEYNRVYGEYFPAGPDQPCRTTIGIVALPQGGSAPIAFEVKAIATV